jgi:hypothetical protein
MRKTAVSFPAVSFLPEIVPIYRYPQAIKRAARMAGSVIRGDQRRAAGSNEILEPTRTVIEDADFSENDQ